ncbi:MAG: hypothetical protein CMO81_05925 [Waddliaceae bacterium]|nr:hypothetical protein [Waddliaceae bacterium]
MVVEPLFPEKPQSSPDPDKENDYIEPEVEIEDYVQERLRQRKIEGKRHPIRKEIFLRLAAFLAANVILLWGALSLFLAFVMGILSILTIGQKLEILAAFQRHFQNTIRALAIFVAACLAIIRPVWGINFLVNYMASHLDRGNRQVFSTFVGTLLRRVVDSI